jgi:hypothetical protein
MPVLIVEDDVKLADIRRLKRHGRDARVMFGLCLRPPGDR